MSAVTNEPTTTAIGGKPYTAPAKQVWGWAAGRVAEFGLIGTYGQAMNVFTVGFGLNPVIVSWCMMLPRLLDGILDPIIGHWSDDMHALGAPQTISYWRGVSRIDLSRASVVGESRLEPESSIPPPLYRRHLSVPLLWRVFDGVDGDQLRAER